MARPRSEEARRKALAAAADLIVERGVGVFSIEAVAARSGVAKSTIYRHWPERAALIIDTARATFEHVVTPDTGSLRGDLAAFTAGLVRADLSSGRSAQLMPAIIDAANRDPEIATLVDRLKDEREQPICTMVARAQARGEIPADLDIRVAIGTLIGPIVFRKLIQRQPIDQTYVEGCLDVVVAGLHTLASTAPSRRAT
jgi:AcrR family transcriptional regulator